MPAADPVPTRARERRTTAVPAGVVVAFHLALVAVVVVGLVVTFTRSPEPPATVLHPLVFFTVQSNVVLAAVALVAALRPGWWDSPRGAVVRGAATLWICVTGIVYHLLLTGPLAMSGSDTDPSTLDSVLFHTVSPVMAVVGWLLLGSATRTLRWRWAALWLVYPLAYLAFALLRGLATHDYPYPFIDVTAHGYGGVALMSVGLCVAFWALGLGIVGLGRLTIRTRLVHAPGAA